MCVLFCSLTNNKQRCLFTKKKQERQEQEEGRPQEGRRETYYMVRLLLVYNAENWNIDAEFIPLHFILINHWPPVSAWSTFKAACA
jgi:hypothetical protein